MTPALAGAARYLFTVEIGEAASPADAAAGLARTCEKLERHLGRVLGAEGIRALLHRARALAAREQAELSRAGGAPDSVEAAAVFLAILISLLARYIGGPLTLQLLGELWPAIQTGNSETS
jgi:hypothetical protein